MKQLDELIINGRKYVAVDAKEEKPKRGPIVAWAAVRDDGDIRTFFTEKPDSKRMDEYYYECHRKVYLITLIELPDDAVVVTKELAMKTFDNLTPESWRSDFMNALGFKDGDV